MSLDLLNESMEDWNSKIAAAEEMMPIIGRLFREKAIETSIFGRLLKPDYFTEASLTPSGGLFLFFDDPMLAAHTARAVRCAAFLQTGRIRRNSIASGKKITAHRSLLPGHEMLMLTHFAKSAEFRGICSSCESLLTPRSRFLQL